MGSHSVKIMGDIQRNVSFSRSVLVRRNSFQEQKECATCAEGSLLPLVHSVA